jgi:hypothetical protein
MNDEATQVEETQQSAAESAPAPERSVEAAPAAPEKKVELKKAKPVPIEPEKKAPEPLSKYQRIVRSLGEMPEEANETLLDSIDESTIEKLPASAKGVLKHLIAKQEAENKRRLEEQSKQFEDRQKHLAEFEERIKADAKNLIRNRAQLNKMLLDPKFQQMLQAANKEEKDMADPYTPEGIQDRINKGVALAMKEFQEPIRESAQKSQQIARYNEFVENHPKMNESGFKKEVRELMESRHKDNRPISLEDAYAHIDRKRLIEAEEKRLASERQARAKSAQRVSKSTKSSSGESADPVPKWVLEKGYNGHRGNLARLHYLRDNPKALAALRAKQRQR